MRIFQMTPGEVARRGKASTFTEEKHPKRNSTSPFTGGHIIPGPDFKAVLDVHNFYEEHISSVKH